MAQEYIFQVSGEIKRRVTKKLPKQFSRTESPILGALFKLDEFLLSPQVRTCSIAVPGTSRNNDSENQESLGDHSLGDSCPEAVFSTYLSSELNNSEQEETHDMVTGVQEDIRYRPHMVTEVQEEIDYCSLELRQERKGGALYKSATISQRKLPCEEDQILLALLQLATNSSSAYFNNNINRISKFPKSLTTTMPTFDGKSEKFELFQELFQSSLKIHNQLTEKTK